MTVEEPPAHVRAKDMSTGQFGVGTDTGYTYLRGAVGVICLERPGEDRANDLVRPIVQEGVKIIVEVDVS